ncbi:MAG: hypothetical protein M9962_15005 [Oligoflexia bacterium]|nr:hypothetical protein [Oligoflexia bacterium]
MAVMLSLVISVFYSLSKMLIGCCSWITCEVVGIDSKIVKYLNLLNIIYFVQYYFNVHFY